MFGKKKKLITPAQLGKELHEFIMNEVTYLLKHGPFREMIRLFNLDYDSLADELVFIGQFAAWSVTRENFEIGADDVMGALEDAFYKELKQGDYPDEELEQLKSHFGQRTLGLIAMESALSKEKFAEERLAEEIGKMFAPVVSDKDPPPDGLASTISIYYLGIRQRINESMKGYQLEGVKKDILVEVAVSLAVRIFKASINCAERIELKYPLDSIEYRKVVLEFLFLFMHLTDRLTYVFFSKEKEKRETFFDVLLYYIYDISVNGAQYLSPKFETEAVEKIDENVTFTMKGYNPEEFNKRQFEYSTHKEFMPDQVFEVFGKNICKIIRGETQDPSCVFHAAMIAMESFVKLHIEDEIKKVLKND